MAKLALSPSYEAAAMRGRVLSLNLSLIFSGLQVQSLECRSTLKMQAWLHGHINIKIGIFKNF